MLQVVFSESAGGSMKAGIGAPGHVIGSATSVAIFSDEKDSLSPKQLKRLRRQAEDREKRNWEQALSFPGSHEDVICLPLALSFGPIHLDLTGPERAAALKRLFSAFPSEAEEVVSHLTCQVLRSLDMLLKRASQGEAVRIWIADDPNDWCGFCHLAFLLSGCSNQMPVSLVHLPPFWAREDQAVVPYAGLGEIPPYLWGRLAQQEKPLTPAFLKALAGHWLQLQEENAPLRALVNGSLVSVPESFYDSFILSQLRCMEPIFREAELVGKVLGQYRLGIGDGFVALRVEQMIRDGLLEPVTQPQQGDPLYHRLLKKLPGCV